MCLACSFSEKTLWGNKIKKMWLVLKKKKSASSVFQLTSGLIDMTYMISECI